MGLWTPWGSLIFKKQLFRVDETIKLQTCQSMGTGSAIHLKAAKHSEAFKGASIRTGMASGGVWEPLGVMQEHM